MKRILLLSVLLIFLITGFILFSKSEFLNGFSWANSKKDKGNLSGELEIKTPKGSLKLTLKEKPDYLEKEGKLHSGIIIDGIKARLDYLDRLCYDKMKRTDYLMVGSVLEEVNFLLDMLPQDYYVVILPYLPVPPVEEAPTIFPMSDIEFSKLISQLRDEDFAEDQLNILRTVVKSNYFLIEQIGKILDCFDFEEDKLEAVDILYPKVLDTENSFQLYKKFEFSDSKEKLKGIIK